MLRLLQSMPLRLLLVPLLLLPLRHRLLALLDPLLLRSNHVPPLVLASIPLVMHLLLHNPLVLRVLGVEIPHRLPPALALRGVHALERQRRDDDGHRQPLRVHTRLHELLLAGQVRVAADERERAAHGGDPGAEDERVAVVGGPGEGALREGFLRREFGLQVLGLVAELPLGVARVLEVAGVGVGGDDGWDGVLMILAWSRTVVSRLTGECAAAGDQEGAEGEREAAEGWVSSRCCEHAEAAEGEACGASEDATFDGRAGVGVSIVLVGG